MISQPLFVDQARHMMPGLGDVIDFMRFKMKVNNFSQSTIRNYTLQIARFCLNTGKFPEECTQEELERYLLSICERNERVSMSHIKHIVYAFAFYLHHKNRDDLRLKLPNPKTKVQIPLVLSKEECRKLFEVIPDLRKKLIVQLVYSCGLRVHEVRELRLCDIDWYRRTVHIRITKSKKNRFLPLSHFLIQSLRIYIEKYKPLMYLFNSSKGQRISTTHVRRIFRYGVFKAGVYKVGICLHTLRHSFATHLLEDGLDILMIKELLGHTRIEHTLRYLHVADYDKGKKHSPIDTLYSEFVHDPEIEKSEVEKILVLTRHHERQYDDLMKSQLSLF